LSRPTGRCPFASRRGFLAAAGGLVAATRARAESEIAARPDDLSQVEPFWGEHQGGIATPQQRHLYFAAFDVTAKQPGELVALLRAWTAAAARMTAGQTAAPIGTDASVPAGDSGDALDLPPARLTLTFGFGAGLFSKDGRDRYGLAARRPAALVDLPAFTGEQLVASRSGGDLSVQACADDPQVAFHAVRQLARLTYGSATLHWTQAGFLGDFGSGRTPRNLMGFKDGTRNPTAAAGRTPGSPFDGSLERVVFVGEEGPDWMRGGSYVVVRRIRMALEHWDRTEVDFQEQVIGRKKYSGAPLGGQGEFDTPDFKAVDGDGNLVIQDTSHLRLGAVELNDGAQILRRGYAYNDGTNFTAERWPPWRQGLEYDAGLFFIAYQRDPREGFIKIFEPMSKLDALNQFTTHVGSGLFACPRGVREGAFIGQGLFEAM
jgi:deferrochelatase/peroxidase EfeB